VSRFGPVFDSLLAMTGPTEQLTLPRFVDEHVPCSRHRRPDSEALGDRIDVIELKILGGPTPNAATAEHLDELGPTLLPADFVVVPQVLGTCLACVDH